MLFYGNILAAPMAGITETVFRGICKSHGADIVVSEMVSAEGLFHKSKLTADLLYFEETERPIGIQLFGCDSSHLAWAAALIKEKARPDFIDINAGCPVPKVVKKNGGASLLRDPELFKRILTAVVRAVHIPVTVKIRSGWNTNEWVDVEFAKIAEGAGVKAITVHPRSKAMGFSGHSFWERIAIVKESVSIPVIGNGDVRSGADAARMLRETGCDAVMIGRGMCGNPWIFSDVKRAIDSKPRQDVDFSERQTTILKHLNAYKHRYGERKASRDMRRQIAWYLKGRSQAAVIRDRIPGGKHRELAGLFAVPSDGLFADKASTM